LGCTIDELEDRGVMIVSAGLAAMLGGRASREAAQIMAESGMDLSSHETQPLTEQLARHADVIYTMTGSHRQAIVANGRQPPNVRTCFRSTARISAIPSARRLPAIAVARMKSKRN
jgi:protein-tyrosine-phosphatase